MKSALLVMMILSIPAFAEENSMSMHLDCDVISADCIEIPSAGENRMIKIKKDPEMTLSQSDLDSAAMELGPYGDEVLVMRMNKAATSKFAEITGKNVGKKLVVVSNGKAIIDPTIQQAITEGAIQISGGIFKGNNYLDEIPWLKRMADERKYGSERLNTFSMISYILLGIILVGGAIHFAFLRKPRRHD